MTRPKGKCYNCGKWYDCSGLPRHIKKCTGQDSTSNWLSISPKMPDQISVPNPLNSNTWWWAGGLYVVGPRLCRFAYLVVYFFWALIGFTFDMAVYTQKKLEQIPLVELSDAKLYNGGVPAIEMAQNKIESGVSEIEGSIKCGVGAQVRDGQCISAWERGAEFVSGDEGIQAMMQKHGYAWAQQGAQYMISMWPGPKGQASIQDDEDYLAELQPELEIEIDKEMPDSSGDNPQ